MSENAFKMGDTVIFKVVDQQPPAMVISEIVNESTVKCTWYSEKEEKFKDEKFHTSCLKKIAS